MKNRNKILFFIFTLALFIASCKEPHESPIKGTLKCYVDESLFNLIKAERDTFVTTYKNTKIELVSAKAREGIAAVLNGEAKMFVSSRNMNDEERDFYNKTKPPVKAYKFCYDGVVPIVKENEPAENIKFEDIKNLLGGQLHNYKVFIPERNSGIYEYLKTNVLENKEPVNVSIVKNEEDVIEKVKSTKKGLGFIGLNNFEEKKGIKILEIGKSVKERDEVLYYYPYIAYLVSENYPTLRLTAIFINDVGGVATGFTSFLTANKGQEIVAEKKLGPATVPVKIVQTNRR
jgi:phosphate transport system substrate-binding protein